VVTAIYRYPVKGLTAEPLEQVAVQAGATLPGDRAWAIEAGSGKFDPKAPRHLPKANFLMLMRDERLAMLDCRFDDEHGTLTIAGEGRPAVSGQMNTPEGRRSIEAFFAAYLGGSLRGVPRVVSAPGHSFSDVAAKCIHIVNLASVREAEAAAGRRLDPLRFRPNVVLDGLEPWSEFALVDRGFSIGGVRLRGLSRTTRCAAIEVDPETGTRDRALRPLLERAFGHDSFGIYAEITSAGTLARGAILSVAS
jgi:uncharacterized protein YcbX